ncbi:hypothetical protein C7H09_07935 [Marinobacter fuscus]|nr:hypothetical protein C7H09_07935 [Marinobacter fuscus]
MEINMKKIFVLSFIFLLVAGCNDSYSSEKKLEEIKTEIVKILERSQVRETYGTTYSFSGCQFKIDHYRAARNNCRGPGYVNYDTYDVSNIIVSVDARTPGINFKCDGQSQCRVYHMTPMIHCKRTGKDLKDPMNSGWAEVHSISEAKRLEDLFYRLRTECEKP